MVYKLIEEDSWLEPYEGDLHRREELYNNTLAQINEQFSSEIFPRTMYKIYIMIILSAISVKHWNIPKLKISFQTLK